MPWAKVPPENVELLDSLMSDYPDAERRSMFGCAVYFIGGNMCIGVHEENFILRLSADDQQEFLQHPAVTHFTPMPGRPMREYLLLPPVVHQDSALFRAWIHRSVEYVRTLPPPAKKKTTHKRT